MLGVYIYSSLGRGLRRWGGLGFGWLLDVSLSKIEGEDEWVVLYPRGLALSLQNRMLLFVVYEGNKVLHKHKLNDP